MHVMSLVKGESEGLGFCKGVQWALMEPRYQELLKMGHQVRKLVEHSGLWIRRTILIYNNSM